jgi:AI-2 transport protein TqsA
VLTICAHPLRELLNKHGTPGWLSTLACILIVYLLIVGFAVALLLATARFAELLPEYKDEFNDLLGSLADLLAKLGMGQTQLHEVTSSFDPGQLISLMGNVLNGVLGAASNLFFLITLVLFMTVDAGTFPGLLAHLREHRTGLVDSMLSFAQGTRSYLIVSTVFGLIVAVIDTAALALMGVPVPVLWGLLAFITNYIPNIGFVIGLVPPAILGLLEGGPGLMLAVIAVYSVINTIIQSVIQPKVVGDAVGLSTSLTFVSLVFWSWVLGPLGALLAIPLSLFVRALLVEADPGLAWLMPLISNRDPDAPEKPPKEKGHRRLRGGRAAAQP